MKFQQLLVSFDRLSHLQLCKCCQSLKSLVLHCQSLKSLGFEEFPLLRQFQKKGKGCPKGYSATETKRPIKDFKYEKISA